MEIKIEITKNLARLIVADADQEILDRTHFDEAESEVETIESMRYKLEGEI